MVRAGDHDPRVYALTKVKTSDPGNEYYWTHGTSPGYSMKKRNFRLFAQTQQVYIVNPTMDTGSSVERLSFGSVSSCRSSAESPRLWFVPVISVSTH